MKTYFVEVPKRDGRSKDIFHTIEIVKVTVEHYTPRDQLISIAKRHVKNVLHDIKPTVYRATEETS